MLTSQTSMKRQRDSRYPKRLEGGKSLSNYNLREAFILCIRIQKCLWDHRYTVSGCWELSAQERGKAGKKSAGAKRDSQCRCQASGRSNMISPNCRPAGQVDQLPSLRKPNLKTAYFHNKLLLPTETCSFSYIADWWEMPISCPVRVSDFDQPSCPLEVSKVPE